MPLEKCVRTGQTGSGICQEYCPSFRTILSQIWCLHISLFSMYFYYINLFIICIMRGVIHGPLWGQERDLGGSVLQGAIWSACRAGDAGPISVVVTGWGWCGSLPCLPWCCCFPFSLSSSPTSFHQLDIKISLRKPDLFCWKFQMWRQRLDLSKMCLGRTPSATKEDTLGREKNT